MKEFDRPLDLFNAAEQGNLSEVKILFSMGADVLARNGHHTVLHSAVCSDNGEVVELFLNKIAETQGSVIPYIDAKDIEGDTPLMWTAARCFINAARILLDYDADVEAKNDDGRTALHWAAKTNHIEVIKLLIGRSANINVNDKYGKKPLDYAKEEEHKEIVGYLVFSEAEILRKQGKYEEAWQAYQEAISIQEDVLGSDHLDTLMTRHNMAEVLSNHPVQKLDEEYLLPKLDELEAIKKDITDYLKVRKNDVFIVRGKIRGKSTWHYALIDPHKKDKFHEKYKSGSLAVADYGIVLDSEWGENPPQKIIDNFDEFFKETLPNDLFVIKENIVNMCSYHYVIIDTGKRERFLEQTKKFLPLESKIKNCGRLLYSGWGQDPPENILNELILAYFYCKENNLKGKFASLSIEESKTLHDAARDGELDTLRGFVRANTVDKNGWTPLHHAAYVGNIEAVKFLVSIGVNLKVKDAIAGRIPVHIAAKEGHKDIVEFLLNKSLEIYDVDENSRTPLLFSVTKLLIERGLEALRNVVGENSVDINGQTPLHHAAYVGYKEAVEYLISIGVRDAVHGRMPVHIAAGESHNNTLELLLNKSLKIYDVDENGWTPLHYATWGGHLSLTRLLIEKGVDIHAKEATRGKKPIHIAAERGYMDIVKFFLESGAEIDDTDREGRTSLYYATGKGHYDIVSYLEASNADIHAENIDGVKPIHVACFKGHINIIDFLIFRGANVNDSDNTNNSLLHYAVEGGQLRAVEFLLKQGANVNAIDNVNRTPLHDAAESGAIEIVKFLLKNGANINARTINGETPLDLAREKEHMDIIDILDSKFSSRVNPNEVVQSWLLHHF